MDLYIRTKRIHPDAKLPTYATIDASGADLYSVQNLHIMPNQRVAVSTGLQIAPSHMDVALDVQVRSRSGLALNNGVAVLNAPGTIDKDYRGEVKVILINHSNEPFQINSGDRIAQIVVSPNIGMEFREVAELEGTARGIKGFGSTGR